MLDSTVQLGSLSVLIGANGSGKTTLLESLYLLSESANGKLNDAISSRGGFTSLVSRNRPTALSLRVNFALDENRWFDYTLGLNTTDAGYGYQINLETLTDSTDKVLFSGGTALLFRNLDHQEGTVGDPEFGKPYVTVPLVQGMQSESLVSLSQRPDNVIYKTRAFLTSMAFVSPISTNQRSHIRLPQELAPILFPIEDGQRLYAVLYNLRTEHPEVYGRITENLRQAFPGFDRLEFPVVARGQVIINWYDTHSPIPLDQTQLSEGTLRYLWLLTILLSPQKPNVLLIDEPEVSLHPRMLMLLAGVMREASLDSQILVASHSDHLLRWLDPEQVLVCDKSDDNTTIRKLDTESLKEWLSDYTLDELWHMGHLGGR